MVDTLKGSFIALSMASTFTAPDPIPSSPESTPATNISTNPCGEIWLEAYGCCDLGALVLSRFVQDGRLDKRRLARVISLAVRFLDNVLDVNTYPLAAIEENCKQVRRLGLGVMGLHDMLIKLGMKYTKRCAVSSRGWRRRK